MNAYEAVLRMCANAAPHPWHPRQYARRSGAPLEQINAVLTQLWDRGLLEKGGTHSDYGPGLRLSARGWEVLNDPTALRHLCDTAFRPASDRTDLDPKRTTEVIDSLRTRRVAYVSWLLLGANILVFLVGLVMAYRVGPDVAMTYLGGSKTLIATAVFVGLFVAFNVRALARYLNSVVRLVILLGVLYLAQKYNLFMFTSGGPADAIRHQSGLLTAADWLHGEWWRALTACFVHLGLLHLLGNMLMLYVCGWFIERMWGSARFLVIYLLAGVTGSLTGLASSPGGIAGASGALCGLIAAEAVWVMFNGKYLPRKMQQEWWNNLTLNFMLIVAISFVGGVSFWGHAGGALAGAAAAVCLHYQHFGSPLWRWAALLGLVPIPLAGLYYLNHERHTQGRWQKVESNDFSQGYPHALEHPLTKEMAAEFTEKVRPVLVNQRASRRTDAETEAALAVLDKQRQELASWREQLQALGPYVTKEVNDERHEALESVTARLDLYERAEQSLREGENYPEKDEQELLALLAATPELQTKEERRRVEAKKREQAREHPEEKDDPATEAERQKEQQQQEAARQFAEKYRPVIAERLNKAQRLFSSDLSDYLGRDPAEWVAPTVKKNLAAIDANREQLDKLVDWLPTLGPFPTEEIGTEVERARTYATELGKLLALAKLALLAGDKGTAAEKAALKKQETKVAELRKAWQALLE